MGVTVYHFVPCDRIAAEVPEDLDEERDWRKNIPLTPYGRWGNKVHYYNKAMIRFGRQGKVRKVHSKIFSLKFFKFNCG